MSSLGLYLNCLRRRLLYDVTNPRILVMNLCPKELVPCFGFGYVEFLKLYQCSCLTASMDRSVQADCSRSFRIRWMAVGVVINEITSCGFCELLRVVSQLPAKETALRCHKPTHFSDEPVPEGVVPCFGFGYVEFLKLYQCSCLTASMDRSVQADCSRSFRIRWMAVGVVINEITSCGFCELLRVVSQLPAKETALRCHKPTHFSDEPVPEGVSALLWFWLCRVSKTLPMLVPDCFNGSISASRL